MDTPFDIPIEYLTEEERKQLEDFVDAFEHVNKRDTYQKNFLEFRIEIMNCEL